MTWNDLKILINKMSAEELKGQCYIHQVHTGVNGVPDRLKKARADLYDPCEHPLQLMTKTESNKMGHSEEEFNELGFAIPRGAYVLEF